MPIEIKELHIRVAVNATSGGQQGANNTQQPAPQNKEGASKEQDELMAECIEQVLQIMENKTER